MSTPADNTTREPAAPEPVPPARLRALDGLRGFAAVLVVISHVVVASSPVLASQFFTDELPVTGIEWLFAETPLGFLWAGQEWVIVFFVLSGLVLSLASAEGARFDPARYYPTRLVRLYLPVWACLVVAGIAHEILEREHVAGATEWLNLHVTGWSATTTLHEIVLLFSAGDYYYSTVLWTLRWEVGYSLLLPLFLLFAKRFPLSFLAAGSVAMVAVGGAEFDALRFVAAFMLGTVIAFGRERLRTVFADRRRYAAALAASPILLSATHWMPAGNWYGPAQAMVLLGACGLVVVAMVPGPVARWMETRPPQVVGRRSFSLYLVHEPIIVAAAFALGGRPSLLVLIACAIVPITVATMIFYRWVERPAQRLAHKVGTAASERVHAVPAPAGPSAVAPATKAET